MAFRFEHLNIWQNSIQFSSTIYKITKKFPRDEQFALVDQLRRAANSISANIAEGSGSSSKKDFSHYLDIAIKSAYEVVSHLYIAEQQGYINLETKNELYRETEILVKKIKAFRIWLVKSN